MSGDRLDEHAPGEREASLRALAAELRATIDASPLAVVNIDADGTVRAWNAAAERLFGWSAEEVVGGPLPHVPDDLQEEFAAVRARQRAGETLRNFETRRRRRDGTLVDVAIWSASRYDEQGRFTGTVSFVADVSERKQAEERLIATQRRLESLQRVTAALAAARTTDQVARVMAEQGAEALGARAAWVGLIDESGRALRAAAVHGYGKETDAAFASVSLDARMPVVDAFLTREPVWLDAADFRRRYPEAPPTPTGPAPSGSLPLLRGGRTLGAAVFQFADGAELSEEARGLMQTFAEKCAHALERARLFDEVRQANAALATAHARLALAQRAANAGVWSWVPERGPVYWSPEYRDLYGFEPTADPSYERWMGAIHPDDRPWLERRLQDLFARGTDWQAVFRIVHAERGIRWVESRGSVERDGSGEPTRFAGLAIDVTERKLVEDRLARLYELTAALAHAGTPEDVAAAVVEAAMAGFGAAGGALLVVVLDGETPRPLAVRAVSRHSQDGEPPPFALPLPSVDAIRRGEIVVCASPEELAARYPEQAAELAAAGIEAAAYAPLRISASLLGVLAIEFDAPRSLDDQERVFLDTLAREAAQALERTQLFQRERAARARAEHERERTERLQRAMARLAACSREREAAEIVLDEARSALGAGAGGVALLDRSGELLEFAAIAGFANGDTFASTPGVAVEAASPLSEAFRTGQPVLVRSLAELEERYPYAAALFGGAVRTELAVPLVVGGRPLGAFGVLFAEEREVADEDVELALTFAAQAAQALERARLYEHEHRVAETLQRSLLPAGLPEVPGFAFAASYLPGAAGLEVGGDWYDAIELPGGGLALVAGDVVGHGVEAAAAMGQLRNAVRVQLIGGHAPEVVLERVNELVHLTQVGDMATLACALLHPDGRRLTYAAAGHPPPLVVSPGGEATFLEGGRSLPLGALGHARFEAAGAAVEPGATIVLYTDGLVERRGRPIDEGLERLRAAASEAAALDPEALVASLLDRLVDAGEQADDVAVLALRIAAGAGERLVLELPAEPSALAGLRRSLGRLLERAGADEEAVFAITVAVGEAAANAVEHAYSPGSATFTVEAEIADGDAHVVVHDRGRWRAPRDPDRGHGLELMKALVDSVDFEHGDHGTTVRLRRRLRQAAPA